MFKATEAPSLTVFGHELRMVTEPGSLRASAAAAASSEIDPTVMRRHVNSWFDNHPHLDLGKIALEFGVDLDIIPDSMEKGQRWRVSHVARN